VLHPNNKRSFFNTSDCKKPACTLQALLYWPTMRVSVRLLKATRSRPFLPRPTADIGVEKSEVQREVETLKELACTIEEGGKPVAAHKPRWTQCVKRLWQLRGGINPETGAFISGMLVRHCDHLFAADGKALELVRFSHQEGLFGGASADVLGEQIFYAALTFDPIPNQIHMENSANTVKQWDADRQARVAFALACDGASSSPSSSSSSTLAHLLVEQGLEQLRKRTRVTPNDCYLAAATGLIGSNDIDVLWRRFQLIDFGPWTLPYLLLLQRSGIRSSDLSNLLRMRMGSPQSKESSVTPQELLDTIRLTIAMDLDHHKLKRRREKTIVDRKEDGATLPPSSREKEPERFISSLTSAGERQSAVMRDDYRPLRPRETRGGGAGCDFGEYIISLDTLFRRLANNTDVLKKCERSAAVWLSDKISDTSLDSDLIRYLRRENWLQRPHRSNISWMKNRQFVHLST